jgi:hypothetical protein
MQIVRLQEPQRMGEFNVYGIYVPALLVQASLHISVSAGLSPLTNKWIAQGWIALPSIFNLCFYLLLLLVIHQIFVGLGA